MSKMYEPFAGSFVCGTVGGGAACRSIADVAFRAEFVRTQIGLSGGKKKPQQKLKGARSHPSFNSAPCDRAKACC